MDEEINDKKYVKRKLELLGLLDNLTNDQRLDIFYYYCIHCSKKNPNCQCWNDE